MKINSKKIMVGYLVLYGLILFLYHTLRMPGPVGEWDDYSLPVASILNDHNFTISGDDVIAYKGLYFDWATYIDSYSLSEYIARDGNGQLTWYFPTYSIVCIPFTLLLKFLNLSTVYAFPLTNLAVLMISLFSVFYFLNCEDKKKNLLVVLLSINPIIFYLIWPSSEVFIYSMLVLGLMFWYNKAYKRAAFFVSVAGMLNPTIMSIGIIMIIEYMVRWTKTKEKTEKWSLFIKKSVPDIIKYGCCYIIGIVPMIYNYYHTGHINLTASFSNFTNGNESIIERFLAYLFDLNYGILPYYSVMLMLSIVLLIVAIIKRNIRYIEWTFCFVINVLLYSIMIHINCGMSGIARYSAWGVLPLIFAIVLFGTDNIVKEKCARSIRILLYVGALLTGVVLCSYWKTNPSYTSFAPVAKWALDKVPSLYNPLYSTFNSRTIHVDGGYSIQTPVVYEGADGYVRKILASSADKEILLRDYQSGSRDNEWFVNQVNDLTEDMSYISVPQKYMIEKTVSYRTGDPIIFKAEGFNAEEYVIKGLANPEEWGTWTNGNELIMRLKTESENETLHADIICSVFNNVQDVTIYVNNLEVYQNVEYMGEGISFDFENPRTGECIEIRIEIPNAISPSEFGANDSRILGLGLQQMIIK